MMVRGLQYPRWPARVALLTALSDEFWMKDEIDVVIGGKLFDFSRFLSWVRYGTTAEHERYDPFNMTLLSGTYYLSHLHRNGFNVRVANSVQRERLAGGPALQSSFRVAVNHSAIRWRRAG